MIECVIRYYMRSNSDRIVRFEKVIAFPSVPFIGSQLSLKNDHLSVEHVVFCEDELPVLIVKEENIDDVDFPDTIIDMQDMGWYVASDCNKNKEKSSGFKPSIVGKDNIKE
jgi:hypothetical protein